MSIHQWLADWSGWIWPLLFEHLWQATLVTGLSILVILSLRHAPPKVRLYLWLIAAAKFAVPSALLVSTATVLGLEFFLLPAPHKDPEGVSGFLDLSGSLSQWVELSSNPPSATHNETYCILTLVWVLGFASVIGLWSWRRIHFSRALTGGRVTLSRREATALKNVRDRVGLTRDVELAITSKVIEPSVWGVRRPVVVLPKGLIDHLSDPELEAVLLHELVHIARRDNLASSLQMLICCLFWFHPFVWLLDRGLLGERERICDDEVVSRGGSAQIYAASLLKVLRFSVGWRVAGVSCAAGSNLGRRVERIMAKKNTILGSAHLLLVSFFAALVLFFSVTSGLTARDQIVSQVDPQGRLTDDAQQSVSGGVAGGLPGGVPGGIPGGVPGGIPGGISGGLIEGFPLETGAQRLREFSDELERSPDSAMQFTNSDGAPVTIVEATLRSVKRDSIVSEHSGSQASRGYVVRPTLRLLNGTDRRVLGLMLELRSDQELRKIYIERSPLLEPFDSKTVTQGIIAVEADPALLTVKVIGVAFADGTSWGRVSPPPPLPPLPAPPPPNTSQPPLPPVPALPPPDEPTTPPSIYQPAIPPPPGVQATAVVRVQPIYPKEAKEARISGVVPVEVVIDEEGKVASAQAKAGHPYLRDAAEEAARKWRFTAPTVDGVPVQVVSTIVFSFSLEGERRRQ